MDEQEWPQTPAKVRKAMEGLDKQPLLGGCGSWRRYQEQSQVVDQIVGPESRGRPARSRREAHETWGAATCTRSTEEGYAPAKTLVKKETRYLFRGSLKAPQEARHVVCGSFSGQSARSFQVCVMTSVYVYVLRPGRCVSTVELGSHLPPPALAKFSGRRHRRTPALASRPPWTSPIPARIPVLTPVSID
ncbi:hypothetical protein FALBO_12212 [Fusarium albosuccineum]|uniref:Uncharacterized protein n=1 Tax=Fusarium albosuccineum TaxID=1237068 RepID=A0A8H4P3C3_9HYPO|nr:hypothetical protein FALBO_12212 [Fusarium albosuccineum]